MLNGTGLVIDYLIVPPSAPEGETLTLLSRASDALNSALDYTWNFGDGSSTNGTGLTEPTHAFVANAANTPYTITLTVTNGTDTEVLTRQVAIANRAPEVNAGPGQLAHAGATVAFAGSATDAGTITAIEWDFDYDGITFTPEPSVTGTLTPTHVFANPGTAVVALRATDSNGVSAIATTSVGVRNSTALLATAGTDLDFTVGQATSFAGSYLFPGGTVSASGIEWDFDYDGTFDADSTGSLTPNFTFADEGTFVVALQITGDNGSVELITLEVNAAYNYVGPTANASNDTTVNQGVELLFSGSYSDPDGTVDSSDIAWDFAYDGTTFVADATGSLNATWTPLASGTFLVALRVTDNHGLTSIDTLQVVVNNLAPTVAAMNGVTVTVGDTTQLLATVSDPGGTDDPLLVEWDLDYDGTIFTPIQTTGDSLSHTFTQAGTFLAAVRATDSAGESTLQTFGITVNSASTLVVIAGADQTVMQGTAVAFSASYTTSGTVDLNTVEWDFDNDGAFNADATGTLTPSHTFNTPDNYVVAVRMTDSNQVTNFGTLHVLVTNGAPDVDAGADVTISEGGSVTFAGTATDLGGAGQIGFVEWDFDFNGSLFTTVSAGSLTPTHTFTDAGQYLVAMRVTDVSQATTIATLNVTVTPVAPAVAGMQLGPAMEGSPAYFYALISSDPDPYETFDVYVSWAPGAAFEYVGAADPLGLNIVRTFADSTPVGGTTATVRVVDGDGAVVEDTFTVTVDNVVPTATLSASGGANLIGEDVPILFSDVSDVSPIDAAAGFTYYYRLNGGDWVSDDVPEFLLPDYSNGLTYTIEGYVEDKDGGQSATSSTTVWTPPAGSGSGQTIVANVGDGTVILEDGKIIGPNQYYLYEGLDSYIGVTLLTSNATYNLYTNGPFDLIDASMPGADVGVFTNVAVTSFVAGLSPASGSATWSATSSVPIYGSGNIGEILLAGGDSLLEVGSRGDLDSVTGPGSGHVDAEASNLIFSNLTGSITGLDRIHLLQASGWIGDAIGDEVWCNEGIGTLLAYGVAATVTADRNYNANDLPTTATIREGGIPGILDLGTALALNVNGPINVARVWTLQGDILKTGAGNVALLAVAQAAVPTKRIDIRGDVNEVVLGDVSIAKFNIAGSLTRAVVQGNLTIDTDLTAYSIGALTVNKNLKARDIIATRGDIGGFIALPFVWVLGIQVGGDAEVNQISTPKNLSRIEVTGILNAKGIFAQEDVGIISTGKDLQAAIQAGGDITQIRVGGSFVTPAGSLAPGILVQTPGTIGAIDVQGKNLGAGLPGSAGKVDAGGIRSVNVNKDLIAAVTARNGGIGTVTVGQTIFGTITSQGSNIGFVQAELLTSGAAIRAARSFTNQGGNIGAVTLSAGGGGSSIHADNFLGKVKFTTNNPAATASTIIAQSGGTFDANFALISPVGAQLGQPVILQTTADFQGIVRITYGTAPVAFRVAFGPDCKLLEYTKMGNNAGEWKVVRKMNATETSVNVKFVSIWYDGTVGVRRLLLDNQRDFTKPGTGAVSTQWDASQ